MRSIQITIRRALREIRFIRQDCVNALFENQALLLSIVIAVSLALFVVVNT